MSVSDFFRNANGVKAVGVNEESTNWVWGRRVLVENSDYSIAGKAYTAKTAFLEKISIGLVV